MRHLLILIAGAFVASIALARGPAIPPIGKIASGGGLSEADARTLFLPLDAQDNAQSLVNYYDTLNIMDEADLASSLWVSGLSAGGLSAGTDGTEYVSSVAAWYMDDLANWNAGGATSYGYLTQLMFGPAYATPATYHGRSIAGGGMLRLLGVDASDYMFLDVYRGAGLSFGSVNTSWALLDGTKLALDGALWASGGTASAPGIAWTADADGTGTGFYRAGADLFCAANNAAGTMCWSASAVESAITHRFAAGTVNAPGIAWAADADGTGTGFYRSAANTIATSVNGIAGWSLTTNGAAGTTFAYRPNISGTADMFQIGSNGTRTFSIDANGAVRFDGTSAAFETAGPDVITRTDLDFTIDPASTGDVDLEACDLEMTANNLLRTSSATGSAFKSTALEAIAGTMDSAEPIENVFCVAEGITTGADTDLMCVMGNGDMIPKVSGADLGSAADSFQDAHMDGNVYVGSDVGVAGSVVPYPALSGGDIGSTGNPFATVYATQIFNDMAAGDIAMTAADDISITAPDHLEVLATTIDLDATGGLDIDQSGSSVWRFAVGGDLRGTAVTSGTAQVIRIPSGVAASGVTAPTCSSTNAGALWYRDETDDGKSGSICACTASNTNVWAWEAITGTGGCASF